MSKPFLRNLPRACNLRELMDPVHLYSPSYESIHSRKPTYSLENRYALEPGLLIGSSGSCYVFVQ